MSISRECPSARPRLRSCAHPLSPEPTRFEAPAGDVAFAETNEVWKHYTVAELAFPDSEAAGLGGMNTSCGRSYLRIGHSGYHLDRGEVENSASNFTNFSSRDAAIRDGL